LSVLALSRLTFKEAVKEKFFLGMVVIEILFLFLSYYLSNISAGDTVKIAMDFMLSFYFFLIAAFSILISANSTFKDINEKMVYLILSKPISRGEYILGKIFGFWKAISFFVFISFFIKSSGLLIINSLSHLYIPHIIVVERIFLFSILLAFMGFLLASFGTLFGVLFSSSILAIVIAFLAFVAGLELSPVKELILASKQVGELNKLIVKFAYYVFPNFSLFDIKQAVVHVELPIKKFYIALVFLYSIVYSLAVVLVAIFTLERREL
jgi:ABC-type transport system involved in multi-copper enzyme maturation permease subunit